MITANAHIAAMAPYAMADISVPAGKRLISLAQNESALPPSPSAIAAGCEAFSGSQLYPDASWSELTAAIAEVHGLDADDILCAGGSMELIACLMQCYAGPGVEVLSTQFGYAFFRSASLAAGADYAAAPEQDFTVNIDAVLTAVTPATRIVCVANPGNPTGTRIARSELVRLRDGLDDDILLLIDEAYGEFPDVPGEHTFDLAARGNTVILRTFSKAYGLAGMRVGWGVFPPMIAAEMRKLLVANNVSVTSQAAAAAAIHDQSYMQMVCADTSERCDRFADDMRAIGLVVPQSHTNFALLRFADADAAADADRALRAEGIVLRGMAGYGLPDCLRATIGSEADMNEVTWHLTDWSRKETLTC
ncbi:MAG: pyridoxal phosphate-dependent aminotransferase [Aestuariivirgaceae bacterium]